MSKSSISYVLRSCKSDFTSRNGFKWPALGKVECPDFDTAEECGPGLYGFLNGCGEGSLASWEPDAQWLLVAVPSDTVIDLGDKVKFPRGEVISSSQNRSAVIAELERLNPEVKHMPVIGASRESMLNGAHVSTGDRGSSTSGDGGTSISGHCGTSTSGYKGTSTSGCGGTSTSGSEGTSKSGIHGTSKSGFNGTSVSGFNGTSKSGDGGTSTSGSDGISISGDIGKSTSGYGGTSISGAYGISISGTDGRSIVGIHGKAKSGLGGNLILSYQDNGNIKIASFFVDDEIVKADTFYECVDGKLVEVLQENINTKG